jgi:hypothetical protein
MGETVCWPGRIRPAVFTREDLAGVRHPRVLNGIHHHHVLEEGIIILPLSCSISDEIPEDYGLCNQQVHGF